MRLEIEAFGETLMRRDMLRFADHLAFPIGALEAAAEHLRFATERQFDTEGAASGGWAPLADSTLREKARHGYPPNILQATLALKESLTQKFDPQHIERLSGDSLTFGSAVPYAIFHATGTSRMPRRPPVALTEADKVAMVKELQAALVAGIQAAGGAAEALARRSSFYRQAVAA